MGKTAVILVLIVTFLGGCVHDAELAQKCMVSSRSDVFQDISKQGSTPSGATTLKIVATLKTPKPGIYAFDVQSHGTLAYQLAVDIDGQAICLSGGPRLEYIEQTLARRPEEGEGMRYRFLTLLQIHAGVHRLIAALPDDAITIEKTVILEDGKENVLELEPIYGSACVDRKPASYGRSSFMKGICGLSMNLNGTSID